MTGALSDFALGGVSLSGGDFAGVPFISPCQTGALGAFALGGIAISGYDCPQPSPPVPPTPPSSASADGHGRNWRPARAARQNVVEDLTTKRMRDDEIVAIWLATFLASR